MLTSQYTYNILQQIIDVMTLLQCASAKDKNISLQTFPGNGMEGHHFVPGYCPGHRAA